MFIRIVLRHIALLQSERPNSRTQHMVLKIPRKVGVRYIGVVERIAMRDQQISVRRVTDELGISKTIVLEIMNNYLGMCKACVRWFPKFFTPLQRANRVECCLKLLQECESNPTSCFSRIVVEDESWLHYYDPLNKLESKVWKKPEEQTLVQPREHRSVGKVMLAMFWDKDGVLLTDYLVGRQTIDRSYHALLIERLRDAILEKRRGKINNGVLRLHDNAPVHKSNIVQAAIRRTELFDLHHPPFSPDIAPSDYHMFLSYEEISSWEEFGF